jgi:rare lipoprotein A
MTKTKKISPAILIATLIFSGAMNIGSLNATEIKEIAEPTTPSLQWLPENSNINPAASTSGQPMLSGEGSLLAEGKASYYSSNLHGRKTASGESFNHTHFTAAHRSLPFGTNVKVINLENGKNVVVRINDRGPHLKGRIIDVSPAAAKEIGLFGNGTAKVRIEAVN